MPYKRLKKGREDQKSKCRIGGFDRYGFNQMCLSLPEGKEKDGEEERGGAHYRAGLAMGGKENLSCSRAHTKEKIKNKNMYVAITLKRLNPPGGGPRMLLLRDCKGEEA